MNKLYNDFPIWQTKLSIPQITLARMQEFVLNVKDIRPDYPLSYNVKLESHSDFTMLYDVFVQTSLSLLDFTLSEYNKRDCWAFVTYKDNAVTTWHNHSRTAHINGVYYLQVNKDERGIKFRKDDKEVLYLPSTDDLIIFPGHLDHYPYPSVTEPRISINMEIITQGQIQER